MSENSLIRLKELIQDFSEMSLTDFRQALNSMISEIDPLGLQYLIRQLKDYRGSRSLRAAIAGALAELEDEHFLDEFAEVIEFETDVSLCRECIQGIVRMGTKDAHSRLVQLSKEKPNATIATLLRQELEKLNQKEPTEYYLNNLEKGDQSPRSTIAASRVLINIGDEKVVSRILEKIMGFDGLARVEAARIIGQLGKKEHLEGLLPVVTYFMDKLGNRMQLLKEFEALQSLSKSERIEQLSKVGEKWTPESHKKDFQEFLANLQEGELTKAKKVMDDLEREGDLRLPYFLKSLFMLFQNQVASAMKYHEEELRQNRVRISRNRQLIGFLAEGMGRMVADVDEDSDTRKQVVTWMEQFLAHKFPDIQKMALFGVAHFIRKDDQGLLQGIRQSNQVEGLMRLLRRLGKRRDPGFIPFLLELAEKHQLVDIQELALQGLSHLPGVDKHLEQLFEQGTHDATKTAIRVVGAIQEKAFVPKLTGFLENQSDFLRMEVVRALGKIGDPENLKDIEPVLYDAKNQELVEACLDALAEMNEDSAIASLKQFAVTTQNRVKALSALEHLVQYYHRWDFPLPNEESEFTLKLLREFAFQNDKRMRMKAYTISSRVITWDLELYDQLRELLKEATSRMRSQTTWDKNEKPLLEKAQKSLNRSFYFLKDAMENQSKIEEMIRRSEAMKGGRWVETYESVHKLLQSSEFPFNPSFYKVLADTVTKELPERTSWREQAVLFQVAGFSREKRLVETLMPMLKTVPKQALKPLQEALTLLGFNMKQIAEAVQIKSVLVFEGSGFFRKRLVVFLEKMGLVVESCDEPDQVAIMIEEHHPDLLLCEVTHKIPGDLTGKLHEWAKSRPNMELIVQTNLRDKAKLETLVPLNPRGILLKPFPLDQLESMIRS